MKLCIHVRPRDDGQGWEAGDFWTTPATAAPTPTRADFHISDEDYRYLAHCANAWLDAPETSAEEDIAEMLYTKVCERLDVEIDTFSGHIMDLQKGRALPKIRQRSEIEDCGSNSDHLSSENASLARQVESMAMRIESLAEELAKPEDVRLREVLDALDGRAVIFDGLGVRVTHLLDEMDEWIARAGAAERRLKKALF